MRRIAALLLVIGGLAGAQSPAKSLHDAPPPGIQQPATQASAGTPDESDLIEHKSYINKDGNQVHSPAHTKSGKAPAGATAQCRDASYSFSKHHSGTCSHHGGVSRWLN